MQKTLRGALFLVGCGLTMVWFSPGAFAQDSLTPGGKIRRPFRVKIGGYFPADGTIRRDTGNRFTSIGIAYDFFTLPALTPLIGSVYINDASGRRDKTFGNDVIETEASISGLGLQVRTYFLPQTENLNFFAGGGFGIYSITVRTGRQQGASFTEESQDSTRLGGKVMAGVEWKKRFFGELEYTFPGIVSAGGKTFDLSGLNVSIGTRF
ncbi:MAG: hypothetical protein SFU56_09355 [Capsulimonadales bacterium]|nr:hypothetical protein [Capsulimonadales bacterium]